MSMLDAGLGRILLIGFISLIIILVIIIIAKRIDRKKQRETGQYNSLVRRRDEAKKDLENLKPPTQVFIKEESPFDIAPARMTQTKQDEYDKNLEEYNRRRTKLENDIVSLDAEIEKIRNG